MRIHRLSNSGRTIEGLKQGLWEFWSPRADLIRTERYLDGRLHGDFNIYYPNGSRHTAGHHRLGQRYGLWYTWDSAGGLRNLDEYKSGARLRQLSPDEAPREPKP